MSKEYSQYILDHKANVQKAYLGLVTHELVEPELMPIVVNNIAVHDMSKYRVEEYDAYDNYFYGKDGLDSSILKQEIDTKFNYAGLHHIHNNPYHGQYGVLINDEDGIQPLEMPKEYVYEMISDGGAFSFKKNNLTEIFDGYEKHRQNMLLHTNTRKFVEKILNNIKNILLKETNS